MSSTIGRRRFLQAGALFGVAVPLLAACGMGPGASDSVRFSSYGDPTKLGLRGKLADLYTAGHPGTKMSFEGSATSEYWDKLATQMAGGNAPDVINIDIARIGQYSAAGALAPLDQFVPRVIETKYFDENLLSQGKVDGKQFGVPVAMSSYGFGYDRTVLESLGIALPDGTWTWDEYAALCNEIRQKSGNTIYGSEDPSGDPATLQMFVRSKGEELYRGQDDFGFSEDTLVEWFEYWAALRSSGGTLPAEIAAQATYGDWPTLPMVKKIAPLGHIYTANLKGGFQDLTDHTIEITLPPKYTKDGQSPQFPTPSSYLSLNARSGRQEEAAAFINWFTNGEEAARALRLISGPPASSAGRDVLLSSGDLDPSEKQMMAYTDLALKHAFTPPPASPPSSTEVQDLLLKVSQDIAFGTTPIRDGATQFLSDARKALTA
ncbi:ABC transporter substrate-binding protein [Pseudonocardia sp. CA-142604]|uniref:ABC transporter substrate-binding protein n=1 Tax=Pseudonocardia sp. CA-142604 TaxID=3240024 RepID=UPI003D9248F1